MPSTPPTGAVWRWGTSWTSRCGGGGRPPPKDQGPKGPKGHKGHSRNHGFLVLEVLWVLYVLVRKVSAPTTSGSSENSYSSIPPNSALTFPQPAACMWRVPSSAREPSSSINTTSRSRGGDHSGPG